MTCVHGCLPFTQTQLMYKWIEPKVCNETMEGAVNLPASGEKTTCPPCNPGFFVTNSSNCEACTDGFYSNGTGRHLLTHQVSSGHWCHGVTVMLPYQTHIKLYFYHPFFSACSKCPVGTEPVVGFEYKWWNKMPSNMRSFILRPDVGTSGHNAGEMTRGGI